MKTARAKQNVIVLSNAQASGSGKEVNIAEFLSYWGFTTKINTSISLTNFSLRS
jgi:hypothetical protein